MRQGVTHQKNIRELFNIQIEVTTMNPTKFIIFISVLFLSCLQLTGQESAGDAHDFSLKDIHGKAVALDQMLGKKLTVLVFWSTWEKDSGKFLSKFESDFRKYMDKGLSVIGVCSEEQNITDSKLLEIRDFVSVNKLSFYNLIDNNLQVFRLYNVEALPTTFLIDQSKRVLFVLRGVPLIGTDRLFRMISGTFEHEEKESRTQQIVTASPEALRYSNFAELEFKRGKIDIAKKYAVQAIKLDSTFTQPLLLLARISLEEKNYSELENNFRKLEKCSGDSNRVILLKYEYLIVQKKYNEAIEKLNSFISKNKSDSFSHALLGYAFGMEKNTGFSEQEFSIAAKLDSTDYRIPQLKAEVYNFNGKSKEANELLRRSRQLRKIVP